MLYTTMLLIPVLLGQVANPQDGAAAAKEVLRNHCLECHGGASIQAGLKVLEHDSLVAKAKVVVPTRPRESELLRRVVAQDDTAMPPLGRRRLEAAEIATLRDWIEAGAADFPSDVPPPDREPSIPAAASGDAQVAGEILADVAKLKPEERRFTRYFTLRHLAAGGATPQHLQLQRAALAKVVNHLSREPRIATLRAIDAHETVFALDIRQVGWQQEPLRSVKGAEASAALDLFDLALPSS